MTDSKKPPQGILIEASHTERLPALNEVTLDRMFHHWTRHGFAAFTSWRQALPLSRNQENIEKLKKRIFAAGYGFIPVLGRYQEKGRPAAWEPSVIVPAVKRGAHYSNDVEWKALRRYVIAWGQDYDQDSVIMAAPSEDVTPGAELIQTRTGGGDSGEPRRNDQTVIHKFSAFKVGEHYMATTTTNRVGKAMHNELTRGHAAPSVEPADEPGRTFALEGRISVPLDMGVSAHGLRFTGWIVPYSTPESYPPCIEETTPALTPAVRMYNTSRTNGYTHAEAMIAVKKAHGEQGVREVTTWQAAQRL